MYLDFSVCVEGLSTEEINDVLERVSSEWKVLSQQLEDLGKKIQLQDDINAYFKQLDALEKTIKAKEEWLRDTPISQSPQQPLPSLKDSCQVGDQTAFWHRALPCGVSYIKRIYHSMCVVEDVCVHTRECPSLLVKARRQRGH